MLLELTIYPQFYNGHVTLRNLPWIKLRRCNVLSASKLTLKQYKLKGVTILFTLL